MQGLSFALLQGETPPGIRTDIDDKPSASALEPLPPPAPPRSKPWQSATLTSNNLQSALLQHVGDEAAGSGGETWIPSPSRPANDGEASGAPLYEARALLASAAESSSQNQSPSGKVCCRGRTGALTMAEELRGTVAWAHVHSFCSCA